MDSMIETGPWFIAFFVALFIGRLIFAHLVYAWIVSVAPECPCCNAHTWRIERKDVAWFFPNLRPSWCPDCGWEGMLQPGPDKGGSPAIPLELPVLVDAKRRRRPVEPLAPHEGPRVDARPPAVV